MIGLDTNVLIRFFMMDDPEQGRRAKALIESLSKTNPGWVAAVTLVELVWVITRKLDGDRATISALLSHLLTREDIVIERAELAQRALQAYRNGGADFADCLIAASATAAGCERVMTFDRKAARDAGMELLA